MRTAVLLLLADGPMHGYQIMQAMADRSAGRWRPSPGAVYPTIRDLAAEGLVEVSPGHGRNLVTLTTAGRRVVKELKAGGSDPFRPYDEGSGGERRPDLRAAVEGVAEAARVVGRNGTPDQAQSAAELLDRTRRSLYGILAGEDRE